MALTLISIRVIGRDSKIHGIYRSLDHPTLRVIDKENGGKADALNAAVNCARSPLFGAVDADSVLQRVRPSGRSGQKHP